MNVTYEKICYEDEKFYQNAGDNHGNWYHVGVKTVRNWYDVNPQCESDKLLLKSEIIEMKYIKPIRIKKSDIFGTKRLNIKSKFIYVKPHMYFDRFHVDSNSIYN